MPAITSYFQRNTYAFIKGHIAINTCEATSCEIIVSKAIRVDRIAVAKFEVKPVWALGCNDTGAISKCVGESTSQTNLASIVELKARKAGADWWRL